MDGLPDIEGGNRNLKFFSICIDASISRLLPHADSNLHAKASRTLGRAMEQ
jgi:hypothetical protein